MQVQKIQGKRVREDKRSTDRWNVTATERKAIKSGIEQGFKTFGTTRKTYEVVYELVDMGFMEVKITTKKIDDWGRELFDVSIVEVFLKEYVQYA